MRTPTTPSPTRGRSSGTPKTPEPSASGAQQLGTGARARESSGATTARRLDLNRVNDTAFFDYILHTQHPDLPYYGLNELSAAGIKKAYAWALSHDVFSGEPLPAQHGGVLSDEARGIVQAIAENQEYQSWFAQGSIPLAYRVFGIRDPNTEVDPIAPGEKVTAPTARIELAAGASRHDLAHLASQVNALPAILEKEIRERRGELNDRRASPKERSRRAIALLKSYTDALWLEGQSVSTEPVGEALLDVLFRELPTASLVGAQDFNGAGFGVAQSLALGMDPNIFPRHFPDALPSPEFTYLYYDGKLADAMAHVDRYLERSGLPTGAEAHERASAVGFMLGATAGHVKAADIIEEARPFATTGLNWGLLLFPDDAEIAALPPRPGFEVPIDCLWSSEQMVVANPGEGRFTLVPLDHQGRELRAEKVIHRNASGEPKAWSAIFRDGKGRIVPPEAVLARIRPPQGGFYGDGRADLKKDITWWGFCDLNAAQKINKVRYRVPPIDRERVPIRAKNEEVIWIPREHAQALLDLLVSELPAKVAHSGFRYDDLPSVPDTVFLKSGEQIPGKLREFFLRNTRHSKRLGADLIAVPADTESPFHGTIGIRDDEGREHRHDVGKIVSVSRAAHSPDVEQARSAGRATLVVRDDDGLQRAIEGTILTPVPWDRAIVEEGRAVLRQTENRVIAGELAIDIGSGQIRHVPIEEISQIVGHTEDDVRPSQYMAFISAQNGLFASDAVVGPPVSNGVRWVNSIDIEARTDDERPGWVRARTGDAPLSGCHGPLERQPRDRILWVRGLYGTREDAEARSKGQTEKLQIQFGGWIQVGKSGRILNEGFVCGQPDFAWTPTGTFDWHKRLEFTPYLEPDFRLQLLVNGVRDVRTLEASAERLHLPEGWRALRIETP